MTFEALGDVAARVVERVSSSRGVEILTPSTREEWLTLRKKTLGASEVAALLGCHPYMTSYELWALKSGRLERDLTETGPMRRGRMLEAVAVEFLREERPKWTVDANAIPGGKFYRDAALGISCTPDALLRDRDRDGLGIAQIKSVEPSVFRKKWKSEDGSVEPPMHVVLQAIQEAYLTGATWAIVAPLVIGFDVQMPLIEVPVHVGIMDRIKAEVAAFWRSVEAGIPPDPDLARDGVLLEQMWTGAGPMVDLSSSNELPALADERERLSAERTVAEKRLKEIKTELLVSLGDASAGRLADGRVITAKRVTRKPYAVGETNYVDVRVAKARRAAA